MKKALNIILMLLALALISVVGSGCLESFWLVGKPSPIAVDYGRADPNDFTAPVVTVGSVKRLRQEIAKVHIETQIDIGATLAKDTALYKLVKDEIDITIAAGKEQYKTWIGSVNEPGVLWSALMVVMGGGGMSAVLRRIWYTEAEVNVEREKAKNGQ